MTLIVGNVVDVGLDGLDGTMKVWAGFRPELAALVAPSRKTYDIVGGAIPAGVEVVPGPAYLEIDMGMNASDRIEVTIPDQATVTIQDLYLQGYVWRPHVVAEVAQHLIDTRAEAERAVRAAEAAEAADARIVIEHEHVHQDVEHVDAVTAQIAALLETANVFSQDQVPPYLQQPVLKATYASTGAALSAARVAEARRRVGGTIGTSGKGAVAFRIDHYVDAYRATVWPLMRTRGLMAGVGIISRPNNPVDPMVSTWAQVRELVNEGNEVWCHSATHTDPGNDPDRLVEEIVTSKVELEAQGLVVRGWHMAGTATTNPHFGSNFTSIEDFNSPVGQLLLAHYALVECYAGGSRRALPTDGCFGLDHVTIESMTLAQLKATVDEAVNWKYGIEFMIHANRIGAAGYLSVADFTAFLDYVLERWNDGRLEVVSPSGLAFADPASSRKLDLLLDGSFEGVATGSLSGPSWYMQAGSGVTIGTDGGRTGTKYARFTPASGYTFLLNANTKVQQLGLSGASMILEGWARAPQGAANARMWVVDNNDNTRINLDRNWPLAAGQGWTRFRIPFVCPRDTTNLAVKVSRFSGDVIDWDDVRMYPI